MMPFTPLPDWAARSVMYQIFPDRFDREEGRAPSDHINTPWNGPYTHHSMTGGNLDGIIRRLDYLEDLGVNLLWLNPILESPSCHKYDTADYTRVSRHFGGDKALRRLMKKAHAKGIRVILDAVCGHCSTEHSGFKDLLKKQEQSAYRNWFQVRQFPVARSDRSGFNHTYECWHGHPGLPRFNTKDERVADYLIGSYEYLMKAFDVDGYRLDAIETISLNFWERFYERMKEIRPDCLLLGEIWTRDYRFIDPPRMDTLTDFPFLWLLVNDPGLRKMKAEEFAVKTVIHRDQLPETHRDAMCCFLSNHDMRRIASRPGVTKKRLNMLYSILLTWPGLPCIYYGDEIGMRGAEPPDSRNAMNWHEEEWNNGLRLYIRDLIRLRRREVSLTGGPFAWIYANNETGIAVFARGEGGERIATALHLGGTRPPGDLGALLHGAGWEIREVLHPVSREPQAPVVLKPESAVVIRLRQRIQQNL